MVSGFGPDGRAWVTGYTRGAGAGGWDIFLTWLGRDGGFEGPVTTFGGDDDDHGAAVLPLSGGDLLIAGYSRSFGGGGQDGLVMRVTAPRTRRPDRRFERRRVH